MEVFDMVGVVFKRFEVGGQVFEVQRLSFELAFRNEVNGMLETQAPGASIVVTCPGDT